MYKRQNEYWMNRLSQLAARNLMDTSYVVDISAVMQEDAPEQTVLGLSKKLRSRLNNNSLDDIHDIIMQYVHCIENHGISQGRNIWLYSFVALVCLDKLQCMGCLLYTSQQDERQIILVPNAHEYEN